MSDAHQHWFRMPAELIEPGDRVARNANGPTGIVRFSRPGGARVTIDVLVDHDAGDELETWRPRPDTDIWLRQPFVGGEQDNSNRSRRWILACAIARKVQAECRYATVLEVKRYEALVGSRFTGSPDGVHEGACMICLSKGSDCECGREGA